MNVVKFMVSLASLILNGAELYCNFTNNIGSCYIAVSWNEEHKDIKRSSREYKKE